MDDYTPTTEEVRKAHVTSWFVPEPERAVDEFERWLASVRADAWDEGFNRGYDLMVVESAQKPYAPDLRANPYRSEKQ